MAGRVGNGQRGPRLATEPLLGRHILQVKSHPLGMGLRANGGYEGFKGELPRRLWRYDNTLGDLDVGLRILVNDGGNRRVEGF